MPNASSESPEPASPEDDDVARAVTFARRTHKAAGIAIEQLAKAARRRTTRRGQDPADSNNEERSAGK